LIKKAQKSLPLLFREGAAERAILISENECSVLLGALTLVLCPVYIGYIEKQSFADN
jgi:hypothetical protein